MLPVKQKVAWKVAPDTAIARISSKGSELELGYEHRCRILDFDSRQPGTRTHGNGIAEQASCNVQCSNLELRKSYSRISSSTSKRSLKVKLRLRLEWLWLEDTSPSLTLGKVRMCELSDMAQSIYNVSYSEYHITKLDSSSFLYDRRADGYVIVNTRAIDNLPQP